MGVAGPGWGAADFSSSTGVGVVMTSSGVGLGVGPLLPPPPRLMVTYSKLLGVVADWLLVVKKSKVSEKLNIRENENLLIPES